VFPSLSLSLSPTKATNWKIITELPNGYTSPFPPFAIPRKHTDRVRDNQKMYPFGPTNPCFSLRLCLTLPFLSDHLSQKNHPSPADLAETQKGNESTQPKTGIQQKDFLDSLSLRGFKRNFPFLSHKEGHTCPQCNPVLKRV
jgi:hypothetical protein